MSAWVQAVLVLGLLCAAFIRLDTPVRSWVERADVGFVVAAASTPASLGHEAGPLETIVADVWGDRTPEALAVAFCESSLRPGVVSDDGQDWGLFQINVVHRDLVARLGYDWDHLFDPRVNAIVARHIYDRAGGWSPWTCAWAARS